MNNSELYLVLLTDLWTIYLTFSGILISIITLLYSFIMGKRSELELYVEQGNIDPLLKKRQKLTIDMIKKMVSINKWIFCTLCISILNCFLSWVAIRFIPQSLLEGSFYLIMALSLFNNTLNGMPSSPTIQAIFTRYKNIGISYENNGELLRWFGV